MLECCVNFGCTNYTIIYLFSYDGKFSTLSQEHFRLLFALKHFKVGFPKCCNCSVFEKKSNEIKNGSHIDKAGGKCWSVVLSHLSYTRTVFTKYNLLRTVENHHVACIDIIHRRQKDDNVATTEKTKVI